MEDKNPPDSQGNTPLHFAASKNFLNDRVTRQSYVEMCRLILDNVDNKHPINRQGKTPLDAARERFDWHDERLQELEKLWLHEEDQ